MSRYIFDNAAPQTGQRFASLQDLFDGPSIQHLMVTGIAEGWRCLEVGGGGGSLAGWMAERVGPTGHVLVTDVDIRHLRGSLSLPNVEVSEHDIVADPLPDRAFDLIHERLVLIHLPDRERVVRKLTDALRPGGWLVVEEFDVRLVDQTFPTQQPELAEAFVRMASAQGELMRRRGVFQGLGRHLLGMLRDVGLEQVGAAGMFVVGSGGSAVTSLMRANFEQVRAEAVAAGLVSEADVASVIAALDDPGFDLCTPTLVTAWGRRSSTGAVGTSRLVDG